MTSVATPARPANNPLVDFSDLPRFDAIRPEHVAPAIDYLLARNRAEVNRLLDEVHPQSWHTLADPLERIEDELSRAWSPVSHLNSVMNNAELREARNACLPKLSEYASEMGQDARLHAAFRYIVHNESSRSVVVLHLYNHPEHNEEKALKESLKALGEIYPVLKAKLVVRKGKFSPEVVEAVSKEFGVPVNNIFIGAPEEKHEFSIKDLGGVRVIF